MAASIRKLRVFTAPTQLGQTIDGGGCGPDGGGCGRGLVVVDDNGGTRVGKKLKLDQS